LEDHRAVAVTAAVRLEESTNLRNVLLYFDTRATIRILSGFDDPDVLAVFISHAFILLCLVMFRELDILRVILPCFDVES
jgi:hypothetical protein